MQLCLRWTGWDALIVQQLNFYRFEPYHHEEGMAKKHHVELMKDEEMKRSQLIGQFITPASLTFTQAALRSKESAVVWRSGQSMLYPVSVKDIKQKRKKDRRKKRQREGDTSAKDMKIIKITSFQLHSKVIQNGSNKRKELKKNEINSKLILSSWILFLNTLFKIHFNQSERLRIRGDWLATIKWMEK